MGVASRQEVVAYREVLSQAGSGVHRRGEEVMGAEGEETTMHRRDRLRLQGEGEGHTHRTRDLAHRRVLHHEGEAYPAALHPDGEGGAQATVRTAVTAGAGVAQEACLVVRAGVVTDTKGEGDFRVGARER